MVQIFIGRRQDLRAFSAGALAPCDCEAADSGGNLARMTSGLLSRTGWRLRLENTYPPKPEGKTAAGDSVCQTGFVYNTFSKNKCPLCSIALPTFIEAVAIT